MRLHDERVGCGMSSNNGLGWLGEASGKARLVDAGTHVGCAKGASNEGSANALDHVIGTVALDETSQLVYFLLSS